MLKTEYRCSGPDELDNIAAELLGSLPGKRIFTLSGPMGSGKTTFIQSMCRQLRVVDVVNSPTFSIVNEYLTDSGASVYHFDLYRLRKPEELLDIGYEDYFFSGNHCFIEWPEMAVELIPEEAVNITIRVEDPGNVRFFTVS